MTERTKIERVGGHLLIEGGSYTGEDNCQEEVALPVATLRVGNRNARSVFIYSECDPLKAPAVIAHGWTAREVLGVAYGGGEWLCHPKPTDETRALVDQIDALVEAGTEEIERLRARVAELEEDNERLRWVVRASCVRTPTPGCDCPGCETARDRSAQVDLVASYEAELEEDRQAERDRILGARVRELARQHEARSYDARFDLYRFAWTVIRAMEEADKEARDAD